MKDTTKKELNRYRDHFGERLPLMQIHSENESVICQIVKECIDEDKPYEELYDMPDDVIY